MPVNGVTTNRTHNVRTTTDVRNTALVPSQVGKYLRTNGDALKVISLKSPMTTTSIAKSLHLSKDTAAKVLNVAKGYQNFGVDTQIQASVMLIPDKTGKEHQVVLVGGPTTAGGKSAWKPGQDYKGTIIDGKTQADVMHIRFKAGDDRKFVYMSEA